MIRFAALVLSLLPVCLRADSVTGTLSVSATIVATCTVGVKLATVIDVQCPRQHPYRVSLSSADKAKSRVLTVGAEPSFSGAHQLLLSRLLADQRGAPGIKVADGAVGAGTVTMVTISY